MGDDRPKYTVLRKCNVYSGRLVIMEIRKFAHVVMETAGNSVYFGIELQIEDIFRHKSETDLRTPSI